MDCWCQVKPTNTPYLLSGRKYEFPRFPSGLPVKFFKVSRPNTRIYARKNSSRKWNKAREAQKISNSQPIDNSGLAAEKSTEDNLEPLTSIAVASRNSVLLACTLTSSFILVLGLIIRQGSHLASTQGWPILDCSTEISFDFEIWHLQLITGLVVVISSSRFLLLKIWPDFSESSEASNRQVLTSLEPLDYAVVAFLPGISEEFLFRGALLPLLGTSLPSATAVAALFGILHLGKGSGRKYSFAFWASLVGFAYGYATISTCSVVVPMASHAINNLIGALIWRQHQK